MRDSWVRLACLIGPLAFAACVSTETANPSQSSTDSLFSEAEQVYYSGAYDSALTLLANIRDSAVIGADRAAEARAITWLGLAHWRMGNYVAARELGEQALQLKLDHDLTNQLLRSYNALGLLAWNENRLSDATGLFEQAVTVAQETDDQRGAAVATGNLALVQTELGEFEAARDGFSAMRATMAEIGETRAEGNALTNLGMLEIRMGSPEAAVPHLRQAQRIYESIPYPTGVEAALTQLGAAYTALGDPQLAYAVLDTALSLAREQGTRQQESSILETLAELYRDNGDYRRAVAHYDEALQINEEMGLNVETGADLRGLADIRLQLGDYERAREYAEQALTMHREADTPLDVLYDLLQLAEIEDQTGRAGVAASRLAEATVLADQLDTRAARVEAGLAMAMLAERNGRPRDALDAIDRLANDLPRSNYTSEWTALLIRSRAFRQLGQLDSAVTASNSALYSVNQSRQSYGYHVAANADVYAHGVSLQLQRGNLAEALAVADEAPGRAMFQGAYNQLDRIRLRQLDQLIESVDYLEDAPRADRNENQLAELEGRISALRSELAGNIQRSASSGSTGTVRPLELRELQAVLNPHQLLLEYYVVDDTMMCFVVTDSTLTMFVSDAAGLDDRVRVVRALLADPENARRSRAILNGLYELLLSGAPLDEARELIFVPHQVLHYLPFAALHNGTEYLAQTHDVRVLPSARALLVPSSSRSDGAPVGFAPFPDELPASELEIRRIDARKNIGRRATERRLRQALGGDRPVHVATHGRMNYRNPLFSRLELAPGRGDPSDDGRFEIHEVLGISISSPLVFLSGCETGLGPAAATDVVQGEDYATLSAAFLHAGAKNVVATLWSVQDEGAAEFAASFYGELSAQRAAAALAAAQRSMLASAQYESPYYWAAYQIAGSN
jgi:CHAT domain-containing protein